MGNSQEIEPSLKFQLLVSMLLLVSSVRLENNPIKLLQEMALYDNRYYLASCICRVCVYKLESQEKHFKGTEDSVMKSSVFLVRSIQIRHIKIK